MADVSALKELQQQAPGAQPPQADGAQPPAKPLTDEFNRNFFISKSGTSQETNPTTGRKENRLSNEYVQFSDGLRKQFKDFLNRHVSNLLDIEDQTILAGAEFELDRAIRDKLSTEEKREGEGTVKRRILSEAEIENFLDSPEGWAITSKLIEQQAARLQGLLGVVVPHMPPEDRPHFMDRVLFARPAGRTGRIRDRGETRVFTGHDEKAGHRWWSTKGRPWLSEHSVDLSVSGLSAEGGAVIGGAAAGPLGILVGGVVTPATVYLIDSFRRTGTYFDFQTSASALASLQQNPAEAAYIHAMFHVNLSDFVVNVATNTIGLAPNPESAASIEDLGDELLADLFTRQEFYKELGVPVDRIDALPEQFLYMNTPLPSPEQFRDRINRRVLLAFREGGYDPAANTLEDNLTRFREMRQQILTQEFNNLLDLPEDEGTGALLASIDERIRLIDSTEEDGLTQKRKAEHKKVSDALGEDKSRLETEKNAFPLYLEAQEELQKAIDSLGKVGGVTRVNLDSEIENRRNALLVGIPGEKYAALAAYDAERARIQDPTFLSTIIAAVPRGQNIGTVLDSLAQGAQSGYEAKINLIDESMKRIEEQIEQLKAIKETIQSKEEAIANDKEGNFSQAREVEAAIQEDYRFITGLGITNDDLLSLTITELLQRVNGGGGWASADNYRHSNRDRLLHAMVEARALASSGINMERERFVAYSTLSRDIEHNIQLETEAANRAVDFKTERAQLTLASEVMKAAKDRIYPKLDEVVRRIDEFTDLNVGDPALLSETERLFPAGYREFMNLIFDYRSKGNKSEFFYQIVNFLPPQELARIISERFNINNPTNDISIAFNGLGIGVASGVIARSRQVGEVGPVAEWDMQRLLRDIVHNLGYRAHALI